MDFENSDTIHRQSPNEEPVRSGSTRRQHLHENLEKQNQLLQNLPKSAIIKLKYINKATTYEIQLLAFQIHVPRSINIFFLPSLINWKTPTNESPHSIKSLPGNLQPNGKQRRTAGHIAQCHYTV